MMDASQSASVVLDDEDLTYGAGKKAALCIFILSLLCLLTYFFLIKELSETPSYALDAREGFFEIKKDYLKHKVYWDERKDQVIALLEGHRRNPSIYKRPLVLEDLPLEVVISYLYDELPALFEGDPTFSLFPVEDDGGHWKILLSKQDSSFWPLPVYLTMEIGIGEGDSLFEIGKVTRGKKEVNKEKGLSLFSREFQLMRPFLGYFSGPRELKLMKSNFEQEGILSSSEVRLKVAYLQTRLG